MPRARTVPVAVLATFASVVASDGSRGPACASRTVAALIDDAASRAASPSGTPVRVNVASSVFGSYSKQTAEQVDLAGNGALADIMQSADTATRAGDRARRDADEALRRASSRRAAPRVEADPSQAWADRVLAESARVRERAASERVVRDLQASAEQARRSQH